MSVYSGLIIFTWPLEATLPQGAWSQLISGNSVKLYPKWQKMSHTTLPHQILCVIWSAVATGSKGSFLSNPKKKTMPKNA